MAVKSPLQRCFTWLWRRPWFRRLFYNGLGLSFRSRRNWRMMNCGWMPPNASNARRDPADDERWSRELYLRVLGDTQLAGRRVLELGSGRGGGACFLHEQLAPARVVGLDYAGAAARWCQRHFGRPGLEFRQGDALRVPFPASSFDAIVCVELTHCIPDKPAFLREAARVLAEDGRLLVADFFYRRPEATHALAKFRQAIQDSVFTLMDEEDLTTGVLAAMRADATRRDALIENAVPSPFRRIAHHFGGTTESSTFQALDSGRAVYLRFVLTRSGRSNSE